MEASRSIPPQIPGYTLIKRLGSGSEADVYLYQQLSPARQVAIKISKNTLDPRAAVRFRSEANFMGQISTHPYILSVYENGVTVNGRGYTVFEYAPGGNYKTFLEPVARFRELGLPVETAMQNDVNGIAWCLADYLPDLGVKVELNHAATAEDLNAADAAIVAVGAHDVVIPVPGADSEKVVSSWDVLAGKVELTGRVAVIGGGLVGTETAEYLLQHGCEVAIVEMLDKIAAGESETILPLIMSDFAEHNVEQHVKTRLTAITDEGVEAVRTTEDGAEEPVKIACDYVVMAVGSKANAFDLDGVTVPVTCVGDCSGERTADIASAIRTAYHAANEL